MADNTNTNTTNIPGFLTARELFNGNVGGAHKVTSKMTGYKKIKCDCDYRSFNDYLTGTKPNGVKKTFEAVATVEIEVGSTVIRPIIIRPITDSFLFLPPNIFVSRSLRTNEALIKRIETITYIDRFDAEHCDCYSMRDTSFKYHLGATVKPTLPFDTDIKDINKDCTSGIHMFLNKQSAIDYVN